MSEQTIKTTTLEIFSSVPFSLFQENIINFGSNANQDKFFSSKRCKKVYENDTHGYIDDKAYIDVNLNIELAKTCKYLRFKNKGRWWYGFILQVEYLNARPTVRFYFELDVINTFNREIFDKEQKFQLTQGHFKRVDKDGKFFITDTPQGFDLGEKKMVTIQRKNPIEWLVVVAKPTIELNPSDKGGTVYGSIVGSYKAFRYFIVPIDMATGRVYPFKVGSESSEQQQIASYMKKITDSFDDEKNTVNQIVNVYTTLYCGIEYEQQGDTIVITDTQGLSVIGIGEEESGGGSTGGGGGSTGGGGTGGTGKAPTTTQELMEKPVDETFTDIDDDKMYKDVLNFPRVKYHGLTLDNVKKISDIVEENGMSRHLFWGYEKGEGLGYNGATGQPWGWLNHTVQQGDVYQDAKSVAKKIVEQCSKPNPIQLAWADTYHNNLMPPKDVRDKGQETANNYPNPSFGRGFVSLTSASVWAVFYPPFLLGVNNGVQDYGDPWQGMISTFKGWKK